MKISDYLKNAPYGLELYSILHGYVYFEEVFDDVGKRDFIKCHTNSYKTIEFDSEGKLYPSGECVLFPEKNVTWEDEWQIVMSKSPKKTVVKDLNGDYFVFDGDRWFPENPSEPFSTIRFHKFLYEDAEFASEEDSKIFFKNLEENGYYWDNAKQTVVAKNKSMNTIDRLKRLQKEIEGYYKHLENYTYSPYERVKEFSETLKKIIEDSENSN